MNYPKITIVTPSFNQGHYLEKTILSVLNQDYPNLEYMVIDGGSADNSVDIIKKYEKHLAFWVSEKDKGQSHAINKGLSRTTGEIFNWLCSDDYLEPGSLQHVAEAFQSSKNCYCYSGKLRQVSVSGETIGYYGNMVQHSWQETLRLRVLKQPSVFFGRTAFEKMGPVNEKLHYTMDGDWLYRFLFLFGKENVVEDDFLIANCLLHEASKAGSSGNKFVEESDSIYHSWAKQSGLAAYVNLLAAKPIVDGYEFPGEILQAVDRKVIERLVFFYLLRRSARIYVKADFEFAQRFLTMEHRIEDLKTDELEMLKYLNKYVRNQSWMSFKLKRAYWWRMKGKHLSYEMK